MLDIFLLSLFSVFWLITFISILRKSIFIGLFYAFLYIYCIFAMIGYCFLPELSELLLQAYFGKVVFYKFYVFNFLSFIAFYVFFLFFQKILKASKPYTVIKVPDRRLTYAGLLIVHLFFASLFLLFLVSYNTLTYDNVADEDSSSATGATFMLFMILYKLLALTTALLYCLLRIKSKNKDISIISSGTFRYLFIISLSLLFLISFKVGSRTDLLAFIIAVVVFEIQMGITRSKIIFASILGCFAAFLFIYLEQTRAQGPDLGLSTAEKIIAQDYYPPAHILFAAIEYNFVQPLTVLSSNVANSLVKLKYPYLQNILMDIFMPGRGSRRSSIAFYVFSEGFMVLGYLGFLYNGFVLNSLIFLWNKIAHSNKKQINYIFIALFATQCANLARSQTSYFIKDLYLSFLPVLVLFFLFTGYIFSIGKAKIANAS